MNDAAAYGALGARKFDVVNQFMVFRPEQMQRDIEVFAGNTSQYIFISSASVYEKPPRHYVITEERTPAINPYWPYSQDKIACEELVKGSKNLPWTIVRPSHTVRSGMPTMVNEGDIVPQRMLQGKPVIVAGDGATPWTLTRSEDFAKPYVGLFGKPKALSDIFHITSDRAHTWDEIYTRHRPRPRRRGEDRPRPDRCPLPLQAGLGRPAPRRQDLVRAVRQQQGQVGRRRLHLRRGHRRHPRGVGPLLQEAAGREGTDHLRNSIRCSTGSRPTSAKLGA